MPGKGKKHPAPNQPQRDHTNPASPYHAAKSLIRSSPPSRLPGTRQALPALAEFEFVELQSHTNPTTLQHPCRAAIMLLQSPRCLLPPSAPRLEARPPPMPAFIQLTPSAPKLQELLCPCLQQSHGHSHRVTRSHAEPSTHHEACRLTALPRSWLEDTFIWSPCAVFVVCPLYPNIPMGWQPAPHMCTHPPERRTHCLFQDCLLGPEQGQ